MVDPMLGVYNHDLKHDFSSDADKFVMVDATRNEEEEQKVPE